jgi:hypothetical protein
MAHGHLSSQPEEA